MTIFDDAAVAASGAVDDTFGENLQIVPMIPGRNKAAMPDPARPVTTRTGTWIGKPRDVRINSAHTMGRDLYPKLEGAQVLASFDNVVIAGLTINQGDRIVRLDKPGQPVFEIVGEPIPGPARTRFVLASV